VQRKYGSIQAKSDKNKNGRPVAQADIGKFRGAAVHHIQDDSGQQTQAAEKMPGKIPESSSGRGWPFTGQD